MDLQEDLIRFRKAVDEDIIISRKGIVSFHKSIFNLIFNNSKNTRTMTTQSIIPFPIEGNTAPRSVVRTLAKNADGLHKISINRIRIRPGFNARRQPATVNDGMWEILLGIPDLADGIFLSNGPAEPLLGDFHIDGFFYLTNGERRFRAIRHLLNTKRLIYPNQNPIDEVCVLLNPSGTTDLERKRKVISTQDNLKLKPMERAYYYKSFKDENKMSHQEIADFLHISRQTVDNYIMATELPEQTQLDIDGDKIKISVARAEWREIHKKPKDEQEKPGKTENKGIDGDEDEFLDKQDNSISSPGTKGGAKEDSGKVIAGKDSIYKDQEDTARWKQFLHRLQVITTQCSETTGGEVEATQVKVIELLKQEFVLQLK